ncbi:SPOR domain-containing protein [Pseudomonas sp. GV071]|jgi:DedD protein|uniref:SPOR domain-containing protein n=1 Tax=Pseudomonas sp. GV071 TaxID=2135754 RepID=UPI000D333D65|nr:SPOR domain-containing protein [Pseudomonas sp. GV071]PTQ73743.1 DedD protein [Pseudomonas sp. GV071]
MALLDKGLKQRIVGALVLLALAIIFLPMLLSRQDESRHVVVDAPAMPQAPAMPEVSQEPVSVPEPELLPEEPVPVDTPATTPAPLPSAPIASAAPTTPIAPTPSKPAAAATPAAPVAAPAAASRLDANSLPISWSIQLASLSSRASAETLQKTLRSQGYNAYIRSAEGMNRVFVGPLIERAEADRLRDQLTKQQKLKGFVVRFQPESS